MKPEEQPPVKVGEIKKALEKNSSLASDPKVGYGHNEDEWNYYDSTLGHIAQDFLFTLPEDFIKKEFSAFSYVSIFKKYIEKILSEGEEKHKLTAVEFGGPGSQLFRGFSPNFFSKTVGVCLEDIRDESWKETDESEHHLVVVGNVMEVQNDNLLFRIRNKLASNKTDLIISRMRGPLLDIDKNGAILDRLIRNWYAFLNENGLIFAEFSSGGRGGKTHHLVLKWAEAVKTRFHELVDIQVEDDVLRLHKRKGAPEELPTAYELFNKN
jgi:hypothetical protein